jgi:hypothetical protein
MEIPLLAHVLKLSEKIFVHRKKLASVGAANQVFFVVTKSAGTAPN